MDEDLSKKLSSAELAAYQQAVADLGAKKVAVIETAEGAVIVKRPKRPTVAKFTDAGKFDTSALEALVRPCLVHPDAKGFDSLLEEQPASLTIIAGEVLRLAGADSKAISGK